MILCGISSMTPIRLSPHISLPYAQLDIILPRIAKNHFIDISDTPFNKPNIAPLFLIVNG